MSEKEKGEEENIFSADSTNVGEGEKKELLEIYEKIKVVLGERPMVVIWANDWDTKPSLIRILSNLPARERQQMVISFLERDLGIAKMTTEQMAAMILGGGAVAVGDGNAERN